jgi:hypothetical protein
VVASAKTASNARDLGRIAIQFNVLG